MSTSRNDVKAIVEQGYDQVAPAYLAWSGPRPTKTRAEYLDKLLSLLPEGASILELGCGAGVPCTQLMADKGFQVTATDISSAQIELAREHVPKATLIKSDMLSLDLPSESFDAVVAFYSLFHLPQAEHAQIITKIAGWLKVGGYALFNFNAKEGDVNWDDWMGAKMFSTSLGAEGNSTAVKSETRLEILVDDVAIEVVGGFEEKFHWFFVTRKK
jgi:ubiquinone/menaquinone biosynthesis C-methylase UbiE